MTADSEPVPDEALRPITELCEGEVSFRMEGSRRLIYMENLRFYVKGVERKMDALLCLNHNNPAYPTKLYMVEKIDAGVNWHETAYLLGRSWHTFSWRDVASNQPPIEILAAHLAPLSRGKAA